MFGIGPLRQRLTIQQENISADTGGGNIVSWTTFSIVWASIEPVGGDETFTNGKLIGTITHKIKMRYDSSITPAMRIVWGSRIFNIRAVRNINERNRMMEILAEEGVAT